MSDPVVIISDQRPIRTLRINRPEQQNRLNLAVLAQLRAALDEAERDGGIRAVILTGTGETFCCGGDLAEFAAGSTEAYRRFAAHFADVHVAIASLSKPVLAALNGDVRAGGMSLLAICDLALARASARFAMPEILSGLWPVMAMVSINRVLQRKQAFELYYFGESFDAQQAKAWGLVNWVVADDQFDAVLDNRAQRLAALPRSAVRVGRTTFAGIEQHSYAAAFDYSGDRLVELLTDPEAARELARRRETS